MQPVFISLALYIVVVCAALCAVQIIKPWRMKTVFPSRNPHAMLSLLIFMLVTLGAFSLLVYFPLRTSIAGGGASSAFPIMKLFSKSTLTFVFSALVLGPGVGYLVLNVIDDLCHPHAPIQYPRFEITFKKGERILVIVAGMYILGLVLWNLPSVLSSYFQAVVSLF